MTFCVNPAARRLSTIVTPGNRIAILAGSTGTESVRGWVSTRAAEADRRFRSAERRQPTMTAAAITVVQSPCLSPTAVWVMFWVRTILFDSR